MSHRVRVVARTSGYPDSDRDARLNLRRLYRDLRIERGMSEWAAREFLTDAAMFATARPPKTSGRHVPHRVRT